MARMSRATDKPRVVRLNGYWRCYWPHLVFAHSKPVDGCGTTIARAIDAYRRNNYWNHTPRYFPEHFKTPAQIAKEADEWLRRREWPGTKEQWMLP